MESEKGIANFSRKHIGTSHPAVIIVMWVVVVVVACLYVVVVFLFVCVFLRGAQFYIYSVTFSSVTTTSHNMTAQLSEDCLSVLGDCSGGKLALMIRQSFDFRDSLQAITLLRKLEVQHPQNLKSAVYFIFRLFLSIFLSTFPLFL